MNPGTTALLCTLLLTTPALAQPETAAVTLRLDPATTEIHFTTGGLFKKHGSFKLKIGQIAFDPSTGVAQGQVLVDAASGQTGDKKFDMRMQNEVLEAPKYPEIFFHAEKVTGTLKQGEQHLELSGSFNMHGADHPLKVEAEVTVKGEAATVKTSFAVPYVAWGMKDESSLLAHGKDMRVDIVAHGTVEGLKAKQ